MSTMRLTGLMSGMDTESIIEELVSAKQTKVDSTKKEQTKLEWKQDIWKGLNTKLKSLQTKISNMRLTSDYTKKTTTVSDSSAVSVITGDSAMNSVQSLKVNKLAKTAYLTGSKLSLNENAEEGTTLSALTKLSDLAGYESIGDGTTINVTAGSKSASLTVTSETTISDVMSTLKEAGLNVNFDSTQQRLYVSGTTSGTDGDFSITADGDGSDGLLSALGISSGTKIDGQDAELVLNGETYTSSSNVFAINGLTITALQETGDKEVTLTTQDDVDGIYDMVKSFIKEYNEVINEIDKLYNADSADDYEPLTDEEKDSMSDTEVEKYETKIKDSLLRNDSTLSTIGNALKSIMSGGVEVNGEKLYLSDFGIGTLGYFTAADNEKNAYHIDGDSDDTNTSTNADKLKGLITTDPDKVVKFFSSLSQSLYSKMSDLSSSVSGYRSYGSFYNDKKLKSEYEDYDDEIEELEEKLNDYEDKWYSKFSAMETALAKLQNNSSAVTSLLGG